MKANMSRRINNSASKFHYIFIEFILAYISFIS